MARASLFIALAWALFLPAGVSASAPPAAAAQTSPAAVITPLRKGDTLAQLAVGERTYRGVTIRSVDATTVVFTHEGGLASAHLRDLPPDLRRRLGYDAAAAAAAETAAARAVAQARARREAEAREAATARQTALAAEKRSRFEKLLAAFGTPPDMRTEVNLQPAFIELALFVKDQGRRPSCAIFAVVSALEFQIAEATGRAEKLSEEYLVWATRKTLARPAAPPSAATPAEPGPGGPGQPAPDPTSDDAGFALWEVLAGLRGYGIPLQAEMPNQFGTSMDEIPDPPAELVARARARSRVSVHRLPGRDTSTAISNLVHALNAGVPVPAGLRWPLDRSIRAGVLDGQVPIEGYAHAVTFVGYRCPDGRIEEAVFIYKNSYGPRWGQGGYGVATYRYLSRHLQSAIVMEVRAD